MKTSYYYIIYHLVDIYYELESFKKAKKFIRKVITKLKTDNK